MKENASGGEPVGVWGEQEQFGGAKWFGTNASLSLAADRARPDRQILVQRARRRGNAGLEEAAHFVADPDVTRRPERRRESGGSQDENGLNGQFALPQRPPWLTVDPAALSADALAPFLRWLDLGAVGGERPPDTGDLGVRLMLGEAGRVSRGIAGKTQRRWTQSEMALPHLVHAIWLGGPLPAGTFRESFGAHAREHAGRADFVLWTDVTRDEVARARAEESPEPGGRPAEILSMLSWAQESGVRVVHHGEVLHSDTDTLLRSWAVPSGFAWSRNRRATAVSHLRVEIITRVGGIYADGVNGFVANKRLSDLFEAVAASPPGFALRVADAPVATAGDVIIAPRGHPALRMWQEAMCRSGSFGQAHQRVSLIGRTRIGKSTGQRMCQVRHLLLEALG